MVDRDPIEQAIKLAREATNGWACFAKRESEHREIARIHKSLDELDALTAGTDGSDALAAAERAFDEPPAEIHRCRVCGTLWNRWQNGAYSLITTRPKACCDNAPMGEQIEKLWPVATKQRAETGI